MKQLMVLLLVLVAGDAFAQPRGAVFRDADSPARQPWMQLVQLAQDAVNCKPALNSCLAAFDVVPAGKRLFVTHVTASLTVADPTGLQVFTGPDGATPAFAHLVPLTSDLQNQFTGGGPTWYFVDAGLRPFVLAASTLIGGTGVATFALSGYFVDVP